MQKQNNIQVFWCFGHKIAHNVIKFQPFYWQKRDSKKNIFKIYKKDY